MSDRNIYLMDEVTATLAGAVITTLLFLDQKSHEPIRLFVKTPGGDWRDAKRICDTILYNIKSPVITIAVCNVQSAGIAILASGDMRLTFNTTEFSNHEIYLSDVDSDLKKEELARLAKEMPRDVEEKSYYETRRLRTHLVPCTLTPRMLRSKMAKIKGEEYEYKAPEAKRLGFVDAIITSVDSISRYERLLIQRLEKTRQKRAGSSE